jgi:hypothetical protein
MEYFLALDDMDSSASNMHGNQILENLPRPFVSLVGQPCNLPNRLFLPRDQVSEKRQPFSREVTHCDPAQRQENHQSIQTNQNLIKI